MDIDWLLDDAKLRESLWNPFKKWVKWVHCSYIDWPYMYFLRVLMSIKPYVINGIFYSSNACQPCVDWLFNEAKLVGFFHCEDSSFLSTKWTKWYF